MKVAYGFTLIEAMLALAIILVLASLAMPMYADYLVRARISEGIAMAATAKSDLGKFISETHLNPSFAEQIYQGLELTQPSGRTIINGTYVSRADLMASGLDQQIGGRYVAGVAYASDNQFDNQIAPDSIDSIAIGFNTAKMPQLITDTFGSSGHAFVHLFACFDEETRSVNFVCGVPAHLISEGVSPRFLPPSCSVFTEGPCGTTSIEEEIVDADEVALPNPTQTPTPTPTKTSIPVPTPTPTPVPTPRQCVKWEDNGPKCRLTNPCRVPGHMGCWPRCKKWCVKWQ